MQIIIVIFPCFYGNINHTHIDLQEAPHPADDH